MNIKEFFAQLIISWRIRRINRAFDRGIITVNEARIMFGLEPMESMGKQ